MLSEGRLDVIGVRNNCLPELSADKLHESTSWIADIECLFDLRLPSVLLIPVLLLTSREAHRNQGVRSCEHLRICWRSDQCWLSHSEEHKIGDTKCITLLDTLCDPAVLSPSCKAAISSNEEHPTLKRESSNLELKSLPVIGQMQEHHWNVEHPDEEVSTRLAECKEDGVPEPVPNLVNNNEGDSDPPPREDCEEDNVHFKVECKDLCENPEPSWKRIILLIRVRALITELLIVAFLIGWTGTWHFTLWILIGVAHFWTFVEIFWRIDAWFTIPRIINWQVFAIFFFFLLSFSPLLFRLLWLVILIFVLLFLEVLNGELPVLLLRHLVEFGHSELLVCNWRLRRL